MAARDATADVPDAVLPGASDGGARVPPGARPTPTGTQAVIPRPPVLASEALQRELSPAAPAPLLLRRLAVAVGTAGVCQTLLLAGLSGASIPLSGGFAAIAALGLAPMAYAARAAATATVAGAALGLAWLVETSATGRLEPLLLAVGVAVLSAALLFRAWHRASWLARALVALGIAVCAGFLAVSQTLQRLPIVDPSWQAWLPQVLQLVLVLLLLLSLLAFMDARSTGGCDAWGLSLLAWFLAFRAVEMLAERYPALPAARALAPVDPGGELLALRASVSLLTALFAVALAQLWSARAGGRSG